MKGDIVVVNAVVKSGYGLDFVGGCKVVRNTNDNDELEDGFCLDHGRQRRLFKFPCKWKGMVVGASVRKTGEKRYHYDMDGQPGVGFLVNEENHKVIMVVPVDTARWIVPSACLEEDLEIFDSDVGI